MSVQCGGFLRTLSLRDCQGVEDAALRLVKVCSGGFLGGEGGGSWDGDRRWEERGCGREQVRGCGCWKGVWEGRWCWRGEAVGGESAGRERVWEGRVLEGRTF